MTVDLDDLEGELVEALSEIVVAIVKIERGDNPQTVARNLRAFWESKLVWINKADA